jgi:hypothetical protein
MPDSVEFWRRTAKWVVRKRRGRLLGISGRVVSLDGSVRWWRTPSRVKARKMVVSDSIGSESGDCIPKSVELCAVIRGMARDGADRRRW